MGPREPCFERVRLIGTGATGRVELARLTEPFGDLPAGYEVAVKTLDPALCGPGEGRAELAAEAEASRLASDASLVRVLHEGEADGAPYLLMQYVPGRSLREALDEGSVPEPLVRSVGNQLAGALAALHAAGLAHGDVKPENVRIDDDGRAVLLDLGFARRIGDAKRHGDMGSLAYLSPERTRGGPTSPEADVFALGIVLYELATGVHPFGHDATATSADRKERRTPVPRSRKKGESLDRAGRELLDRIALAAIVPPSQRDLSLSPFLDHVLIDVLARDPGQRPSARELATRLGEGEASTWWRQRIEVETRGPGVGPARRLGQHLSPLVGRDRELARLRELLDGVRAGRPAFAWIGGPSGCGKWRLVSEFAASARTSDDPPIYLYARWREDHEARPAGALVILLHRWLRLPVGAEPSAADASRLEQLVGPHTAETLLKALSPERSSSDLTESVPVALAKWLGALGATTPVIVFLDDLQRAGPVTRDALLMLVDELGSVPVLITVGVREDAPGEAKKLDRLRARLERLAETPGPVVVEHLRLAPLGREGMRELVDALFDQSVPRGRLTEVLWKRSRGNPGLAIEIIHELMRDGRARYTDGRASENRKLLLSIAPDELPLPRSLDGIIAERVRKLSPEDRRWLERLSVLGGRIAPETVLRAFPPTGRAEIDEVLARLVRQQWLVPVAVRYRFARPALREALYMSLSPVRKRRLHLAAARGLRAATEERGPDPEAEFQRAYHLEAAQEYQELLDTVVPLVRSERRRASARRVLALAEWGLDALRAVERDDGPLELELLEAAADAANRLGRRERERELLDAMLDLELDLDKHPAEGARLYLLHARHATGTGQFGLARGMLRNALQLAYASGDDGLVSQSLRLASLARSQVGELTEARELALDALAHARGVEQVALAHLALGHANVLDDDLEGALDAVNAAVQAIRDTPDIRLVVAGYAHLMRARIWRSLGRSARALGSAHRAVEAARRAGERRLEVEARARLGGLYLDLDRVSDAEAELRDAALLADEIEDRRGQVIARTWLGLLLMEEDDPAARAMVEHAAEVAHDIGFARAEAYGRAVLAREYRCNDDLERAEEWSAIAVDLLERHDAELSDRIVIAGTRIAVLEALGRRGDAKKMRRALDARIDRAKRLLRDERLREDLSEHTTRLLAAVLTFEGPVLPRRRG